MKNLLNPFLGTLAAVAMTQAAAQASPYWWDTTTTGTWATAANWWTTAGGTVSGVAPGALDDVTFNGTSVNGATIVQLNADTSVNGMTFANTGTTTIKSFDTTTRVLTLGTGGITVNAGAGIVTLGDATNKVNLVLGPDSTAASYTFANNNTVAANTLLVSSAITGGTGGTAGAKILNVSTAGGGITLSGAITNGGATSLALNLTTSSSAVTEIVLNGGAGNTYTGGTSIGNKVRLNISTANSLGGAAGLITVSSGGILLLNSANTVNNDLNISGNGGGGTGIGAIRIAQNSTINGDVTLSGNSTIGVDSGRSASITGDISGEFNLDKVSTATTTSGLLTLSGKNTYSGTTTITQGVISFGKKQSLYDSDTTKWTPTNITVASGAALALGVGTSASGYWDAAEVAAFLGASQMGSSTTLTGFKSGSLIGFDTTNAGGTFTYGAIGNIGASTNNGFVKLGAGTLILNATNTYTGATAVEAGTLNLASTGSISGTTVTVANGSTLASAGSIGGSTLTVSNGIFSSSGTAAFTGAASLSNSDSVNTLATITGGTFTAASMTLGRTNSVNYTSEALAIAGAGSTTSGFYVNGGATNISGDMTLNGSNSTASARIDSGALTVGGIVTIGLGNTGRWSVLNVNGGTFTSTNTATGIQLGSASEGNALFLVGGTSSATVEKITFNRLSGTGAYTGEVLLNGGTLNVGSGGMVITAGTNPNYVAAIKLTSGTLGAKANWSSTLNMTLGTNPTIQAADSSGTARNITLSGVLSGGGLTKTGAGTLELSGDNTYTGATTVSGGTLTLSGAKTGASGNIVVSNVASTSATLNISKGTYALGTNSFMVGNAATTAATGTVNQSGGSVTFSGASTGLIIGNVNSSAANTGIYNLSGGSITTGSSTASRGIIIGTNTGTTGEFNLSGTGALNMTTGTGGTSISVLQVGRFDAAANNTTATFNQTGGTAKVAIFSVGGNGATGSGISSTVSWTGGTFVAETFPRLAVGNTNTAILNIGGTADVTLPALPTARGTSSTATLNFDGGTLRPYAASTTYISGLTNAFIKAGGAKFDVASGNDITITQNLLTHGTSTGGGLTKDGVGSLTLSGANTYTGATLVSAGTLTLSNSLALQNSVLDTLNSIAGDATNGLKTTVTTLTLGGLTGNKNLADVFTTTSGGYSTVTTLTLNPGTSVTHSYSGGIANGASAMALAKSGAGTQVLSGANSYSGGTTISGGTLSLSGSGTLGASTGALSFTGNSTTLNIGSTTQTVASVTAGNTSNNWSSTITGTGGKLNVSGNLVYQGKSSNGSTNSSNPTLGIDTDVTVTGNTLLGRANLTISSGTYSTANFNQATGSADWANLIIQGTANVTAGSIDMRNVSAATGQVVLNGGTLTTGSIKAVDRELGGHSILLFNGTQVIASGSSTTFVDVTAGNGGANQAYIGTGGALINSNGNNVTITAALKDLSSTVVSNDTGLGGATAGAGFLTKSGAGTLTLSGTNTYTGETKVDEGKLVVNGSVSTSITTTVASGATLAGIGTVGAATISGILAPGNSIGTITATGDVTWNDNDAWVFELGSAASTLALAGSGNSIQDLLNITGAGNDFLKGTGSSFTFDFSNTGAVGFYKLVDWAGTTTFTYGMNGSFVATNLTSGLTGTFTVDNVSEALYLTVVPEPDAALLGSLGMLALLRRRRS